MNQDATLEVPARAGRSLGDEQHPITFSCTTPVPWKSGVSAAYTLVFTVIEATQWHSAS